MGNLPKFESKKKQMAKRGNPNWKKDGNSPNPGGRPKSQFGALIREKTKDGANLVNFVLELFGDKNTSKDLRLDAATWLADRGWGKPQQSVELGAPDLGDWNPVILLPTRCEGRAGTIQAGSENGKASE